MIAEDLENFNFHPILKDIENMFWLFVLSNLVLMDFDVQNIIKNKKEPSILPMLEKYNKWVNLKIKINTEKNTFSSKSNISNGIIFIGKAMAILTYDFILDSEYKEFINKSQEFKFLRFIRNAASHYNKFDMKYKDGKWKLEKNEVIKCFLNKEISRKVHGKKVFNDFVSVFDIFLLANYFSEKLKEIDKK